MSKTYSPREAAILVLKKAEELLAKAAMGGLKVAKLTPVPGVISPTNTNTATPNKVGSQAVVKAPKAKKLGQVTDKPSVFFGKAEDAKKSSIENLRDFLEKHRSKKEI